MIIHNSKNQNSIKYMINFFFNEVSKCDFSSYFNIYISNNIMEDYNIFDDTCKLSNNLDPSGVTILPIDILNNKMQILIHEDPAYEVILHELTHAYDFLLFSDYFCNGELFKVKYHKYYQSFVYWSEFHAKQIDIPYLSIFIDFAKSTLNGYFLSEFKKEIKSFYHPRYTQKFVSKNNPNIRDLMWYLGEICVCNNYDNDNTYSIPQKILTSSFYDLDILSLNNILVECQNFEGYVANAENLHHIFHS